MAKSSPHPILYSFRRCPYAIRARVSLIASGTRVELREVQLKNKPKQMIEVSPKATVPVLILPDGSILEESLEIMDWALGRNDPEGWLPVRESDREITASLVERNDTTFKFHLDRYKYPTRYEHCDGLSHRGQAEEFVALLDARLAQHCYLLGPRISLADIAIFPFVRQFSRVDPDWFEGTRYAETRRWLQHFLESDSFSVAMKKYKPWAPKDSVEVFPDAHD